ncbi:MAG TPA: SulP family inorganic anion transporter [Steroidobacteraceae bacterium]
MFAPFAGYDRRWLQPDIIAGLAAAAVVVPKALAYATIAGLPVQVGLYTACVPMAIYAVLGTSRPLSVSTTTTIAILSASALAIVAPHGGPAELVAAAATLAFLVGILLAAAGLLRLGFIANFISEPVLTGFKSGIGLVIVVDQAPKLLGIHFDKGGFFQNVFAIARHAPETSVPTLLVAAGVLLLIAVLEKRAPKLPVPLIAVAAAIAASAFLGLEPRGVSSVGDVPGGLPSLMLPQLDIVSALWPAAAGIALMSFTESIAAGRAFAQSGEPRPEPNRELIALGAANAGGGLFGAMPAGGGTSQTAVNRGAGAKSQLAELVTAASALVIILVLAPLLSFLPQAALAAVVIAYSVGLMQPREFAQIRSVRTREFRWALIAFAGVVLLGTLQGILVAVIVSLVSLAHQAYSPPVYPLGRKRGTTVFRPLSEQHPDDERWPGLLLVRVEGRIFFANAQRVGDLIWPLVEREQPRVLVLDCRAVIDLEYTALKMLTEAEARLREAGIDLWLASLPPAVFEIVERSTLGAALGHERMFLNLESAVERFERENA